jgi:hypothetical protein
MKRCRFWQKRIPEALYGEMDPETRDSLDRHLATCGKCARLYRGLAETVRLLDVRPAPDREPEFWEEYWDRFERRRAQGMDLSGTAPRAFPVPRWAYGALGATLFLALGVFLGRTLFSPRVDPGLAARPGISETSPAAQPSPATGAAGFSLEARASRYLRRSRVILLAVVNSDPGSEESFNLSLPLQKRSSEELVQEAAVLKKELRSSDRRLERLVSDLEMILLQIANLKPQPDASAVEIIKAGIESRDVFFKINLNEVRRATSGEGTERGPGRPAVNPKAPGVKTAPRA